MSLVPLPHGKLLFSFSESRGPQWAVVVLGLALLLAGGLVALVFALQGLPARMGGDDIAGLAFIAALPIAGLCLFVFGLRDFFFRAEWHVTGTHAYRTRGSKVVREIALARHPKPTTRPLTRYGQVLNVIVDFGGPALLAPNPDVARAVVEAWDQAASGTTFAPASARAPTSRHQTHAGTFERSEPHASSLEGKGSLAVVDGGLRVQSTAVRSTLAMALGATAALVAATGTVIATVTALDALDWIEDGRSLRPAVALGAAAMVATFLAARAVLLRALPHASVDLVVPSRHLVSASTGPGVLALVCTAPPIAGRITFHVESPEVLMEDIARLKDA